MPSGANPTDWESMRPMDGMSLGGSGSHRCGPRPGRFDCAGQKFCVDFTAKAEEMDPIVRWPR